MSKGTLVFGKPREGAERREEICVVVQRKSDGKFLLLNWSKFGWVTPVLGGIEKGETPESAAERELFEETGYKGKAIKRLGSCTESHFFAEHKNVWRYRISQPILMEVLDETALRVSDKENMQFEVIWMTADEALEKITHRENKIGICRYLGIEEPAPDSCKN